MSPFPRDREKLSRMEQAVRVLIHGLGEDLEREGLRDTPKRVAKALLDCTHGYHQDTSSTLGTALFHEPIVHQGDEGVVVVRDIDFASTSEETLLPFHGRCHVAYRPKDGVVLGLSKLARLTKQYAKRLQTQERLAAEIAAALQQSLECHGVAVVLSARHLSNSAAPEERTNACVSGVFAVKGSAELEELLSLLGLEDVSEAAIHNLDRLPRALVLGGHMRAGGAGASRGADPGVTAPGTPDPSEKDTDGDSDDLLLESSCCCDEMEAAVQQLLLELGENPHRPGLAGSARRYVMSLLASTSGYHQQQVPLQTPVPAGLVEQGACGSGAGSKADGACTVAGGCPGPQCDDCASRCGAGVGNQGVTAEEGGPRAGSETEMHSACTVGGDASGGALDRCPLEDEPMRPRGPSSGCCASGACCARVSSSSSQHRSCVAAGAALEGGPTGLSRPVPATGPLCGAVTLRLPFASQCEHHMLPFYGTLMVSYFPACAAAGSAAALPLPAFDVEQVVSIYTQRLQVQERITHQVADAVEAMLRSKTEACPVSGPSAAARQGQGCVSASPSQGPGSEAGRMGRPEVEEWKEEQAGLAGGVMVVCDAAHMCMVARGVENHSGSTTTFAVRGAFAERPELRRAVVRLFREHS